MITTARKHSASERSVLPRWTRKASPSTAKRPKKFTCFPRQYFTFKKVAGADIAFRTIQPQDESLLIEFHKTVSDQSVHFRYFGAVTLRQRTLHERLRRHCAIDHTREFALVADWKSANGTHQILGVARLFKETARDEAEFAILVTDRWQGTGLGTCLLRLLVRVGGESHLRRIVGRILSDNAAMLCVSRKLGFSLHFDALIGEWVAERRF